MLEQNKRVQTFLDAITKEAKEQHNSILAEMESVNQAELAAAQQKAAQMAEQTQRTILSVARQNQNQRLAAEMAQQRVSLAQQRQKILEDTFLQAKKKLQEFTQAANYPAFLRQQAEKLCTMLSANDVILFVRAQDQSLLQQLACEVRTDDQILIGGCRAQSEEKQVILDDTLDSRLEQQRDWFLQHAKLSVEIHLGR